MHFLLQLTSTSLSDSSWIPLEGKTSEQKKKNGFHKSEWWISLKQTFPLENKTTTISQLH